MKRLTLTTLLALGVAAPALAEMSREELLQNTYEMRMRFEADQASSNQAAAAQAYVAEGTADSPTVTAMRSEVKNDIRHITSNNVCRKLNVNNEGGVTTVVCGANSGVIDSDNTVAGRDVIKLGEQP